LTVEKINTKNCNLILKIKKQISILLNTLAATLFQPRCKGCGNYLILETEKLLCKECQQKIDTVRYSESWKTSCRYCGKPMDHSYDACGNCIIQPPPFRKHRSYSRYDGVLKDLILAYKYGNIERLKVILADYLIQLFQEKINEPFDYIIPVPADKGRKREFHPMSEVSKILSRQLSIPLLNSQLIKIKATPPQAGLSRAQRLKNLDGAFKLKSPSQIKSKKILLVDDVYTTGTTIRKCSQLLIAKEADVVALTLARS